MKPITITEAGLKMAQAQESLQSTIEALKAVSKIVVEKCSGTDELTLEKQTTIREAFVTLLALRDQITK